VASVKRTKKNLVTGDGQQEDVVEFKLWDKLQALEMLAKHFALLTEVVKYDIEIALLERLDRGRARMVEAHKLLESAGRVNDEDVPTDGADAITDNRTPAA
jgi:hypothetical protein